MAEQSIINLALQQGVWAVLFVSLYFYQLKDSRRRENDAKIREEKLTGFITDITKQFENLARQYEKISDDVQEIRCTIRK